MKWKLLLLSNDISENPGPEFYKVICGSFNQGIEKFGDAAGQQCAAILLYSVAFKVVKDVRYWDRDTLDSLVEHGTELYRIIGKNEFLAVEDLPNVVKIFDQPIHMDFNFNSHGILSKEMLYVDTMKDMICSHMMSSESTCNSGFLLWLSENCISVLIRARGTYGVCCIRFPCKGSSRSSKFRGCFCFVVFL